MTAGDTVNAGGIVGAETGGAGETIAGGGAFHWGAMFMGAAIMGAVALPDPFWIPPPDRAAIADGNSPSKLTSSHKRGCVVFLI
jgi:hypothetical protein